MGRSQRLHGPSKLPSVTAKEPMTQKGEVPRSLSLLSLLLTEACAHFLVPQQRQSSSSEERSEPNWMVNGKESLAGGSGRERDGEAGPAARTLTPRRVTRRRFGASSLPGSWLHKGAAVGELSLGLIYSRRDPPPHSSKRTERRRGGGSQYL